MDIKELNKISIKTYLANKGIYPVKDRGYYGMYRCPFREDSNASLKVDYSKNLWIDFGSNEGGTMIDLVMRINNYSLQQAIEELKKYNRTSVNQYNSRITEQTGSFSFHGNGLNNSTSSITIQKIQPITHQALIDYLSERKISIDIANQYCSEIHYSVNDKPYFAIGFQNDSKGWILRSEPFKGCTSMDITTYFNRECCLIFEGFTDFLSYLTLKNTQTLSNNIVVLNSVANLSKAMDFIKLHSKTECFLDNDEAGRKATQIIKQTCTIVIDQSAKYANYKDLNEYLVSTKKVQSEKPKVEVNRKPLRGFRR